MSDWKKDLGDFFEKEKQKTSEKSQQDKKNELDLTEFFSNVVAPAFEEIKNELEKFKRTVEISIGKDQAQIQTYLDSKKEFDYSIKAHGRRPYPETIFTEKGKTYRAEGYIRSGAQNYSIDEVTKDEIISHFLEDYKRTVSRKIG